MNKATFKPVSRDIAQRLADFICSKNVGKSVAINGETYRLDYISRNSSQFFRSRGLSAYFRVGRSVVRISDHWSKSKGHERSRKLNCVSISGKQWELAGRSEKIYLSWQSGKYPWVLLAGRCGLSSLNKTCDHFTS